MNEVLCIGRKPLWAAILLVCHQLALAGSDDALKVIDLRAGGEEGVVTLQGPDPAGEPMTRSVGLPAFESVCFFAPDAPAFRWIGASNRMLPWVAGNDLRQIYDRKDDQNPAVPPPNRRGLFMLAKLAGGDYLAVAALAGPHSCSYLQITKDGKLIAGYSTSGTERPQQGPIPLLAWARHDDVYAACAAVWRPAVTLPTSQGRVRLRGEKVYPEVFKYLGWCSWEQFHGRINQRVLGGVADEIDQSDVPVRWLLVDDGHQTQYDRSIVSLQPNRGKFPEGWGPLLSKRRPDGIRWMGIWHCLLGHWNDIAADHTMRELDPYLTPRSDKPGAPLVPKVDAEASRAFYDAFIGSVAETGFDFMKIDNMSRATLDYQAMPNAARAEWFNTHALDIASDRHHLPFIACSSQNTICLLNTWHCAVMRCSIDYRRDAIVTAKSHVFQSFANTLWMGQTLWPDHDMFHSSDASSGELMAVTKALSGGPVYLSDRPGEFREDFIMPLCYADGLLLRPEAPGVPLPDSALQDALNDATSAYQVVAPLAHGAVAIAGFNLVHPTPSKAVRGHVDASDYACADGLMQPRPDTLASDREGLVVYDWRNGRGGKLTEDGVDYTIEGFDYQLFLVCPIRHGWAVVGRVDKYLSPVAVQRIDCEDDTLTLTLHEAGPLVVYSEQGPVRCDAAKFKSIGNGLWRADLPQGDGPVTLRITR